MVETRRKTKEKQMLVKSAPPPAQTVALVVAIAAVCLAVLPSFDEVKAEATLEALGSSPFFSNQTLLWIRIACILIFSSVPISWACFLALQPHMDSVAERIRRGLPSPDGQAVPFACGFTFGEQGQFGSEASGQESIHGNLMFNVCLFGGPKANPGGSSTRSPRNGLHTSLGSPGSPKKASLYKRLRQFLLHPSRFHSMSQMLAEFDQDGDSAITPKEFGETLRRFGFELTDEERAQLIEAIDGDGDGSISFTELFVYLQSGGNEAARSEAAAAPGFFSDK